MRKPITIEDLPKMLNTGCMLPGCNCKGEPQTELALASGCHPPAGTRVYIHQGSNLLRIECNYCGALVCEVVIGSNEQVVTVTA